MCDNLTKSANRTAFNAHGKCGQTSTATVQRIRCMYGCVLCHTKFMQHNKRITLHIIWAVKTKWDRTRNSTPIRQQFTCEKCFLRMKCFCLCCVCLDWEGAQQKKDRGREDATQFDAIIILIQLSVKYEYEYELRDVICIFVITFESFVLADRVSWWRQKLQIYLNNDRRWQIAKRFDQTLIDVRSFDHWQCGIIFASSRNFIFSLQSSILRSHRSYYWSLKSASTFVVQRSVGALYAPCPSSASIGNSN